MSSACLAGGLPGAGAGEGSCAALGGKKRSVEDGDISPSLSPEASAFIRRLLRKDPPNGRRLPKGPLPLRRVGHSTDERWEAKASERLNVDCSDLEFEATTPKQQARIRDGVARTAWLGARGTADHGASDERVRVRGERPPII